MSFDPARAIQDLLTFGEFGDVNPSITDSSTYTFLNPATMQEIFSHDMETSVARMEKCSKELELI